MKAELYPFPLSDIIFHYLIPFCISRYGIALADGGDAVLGVPKVVPAPQNGKGYYNQFQQKTHHFGCVFVILLIRYSLHLAF